VLGSGGVIRIPSVAAGVPEVDYEGELGIVINTPCKNVTKGEVGSGHAMAFVSCACVNAAGVAAQALNYVGYLTVCNDVSARRWQVRCARALVCFMVVCAHGLRAPPRHCDATVCVCVCLCACGCVLVLQKKAGGQFSRAKSFDTFCPFGPALVPLSSVWQQRWRTVAPGARRQSLPECVSYRQVKNPRDLGLRTTLNGKLMQVLLAFAVLLVCDALRICCACGGK
jgi:2-keto-4-pentenoate hydratase/2-oxohepta-3-ene-1,7-dioic acid hydratase in catechol pathway